MHWSLSKTQWYFTRLQTIQGSLLFYIFIILMIHHFLFKNSIILISFLSTSFETGRFLPFFTDSRTSKSVYSSPAISLDFYDFNQSIWTYVECGSMKWKIWLSELWRTTWFSRCISYIGATVLLSRNSLVSLICSILLLTHSSKQSVYNRTKKEWYTWAVTHQTVQNDKVLIGNPWSNSNFVRNFLSAPSTESDVSR